MAYRLGVQAQDSPAIRSFVEEALKLDVKDSEFQFATRVAQSWINHIRLLENNPSAIPDLLEEIIQWVTTSNQIVELIKTIYHNTWSINNIQEGEVAIVLRQKERFWQVNSSVDFIGLLGNIFFSSPEQIKSTVEETLETLDSKRLSGGLGAFLEPLTYAIRSPNRNVKQIVSPSLRDWILNQVLCLPDIDNLSSTDIEYLHDVLKILGKPNLQWLVSAVEKRIQQISNSHIVISKYYLVEKDYLNGLLLFL